MRSESGISGKYNSTLLFSSRETCYKKPFGAVATESDIEITFPVKESFLAEGVDMIVRLGEKTKKYSLTKIKTENGYDIFYVKFSLKQKGVYFYRFEIAKNGVLFFVGRGYNGKAKIQDWLPEWHCPFTTKIIKRPIYNGGVVYHIFADGFCYKGPIRYPKYGVLKQCMKTLPLWTKTAFIEPDFLAAISEHDLKAGLFGSFGSEYYLPPHF